VNANVLQILKSLGGNAQGPPMPQSGVPSQNSSIATMFDPKGAQGTFARGKNIYAGGLMGPPGAGRPTNPKLMHSSELMGAIQRRLGGSSPGN
jgi:hypothetical protein